MKFDIDTARDPSLSCAAAKVMILDAADALTAAHDLIREMRRHIIRFKDHGIGKRLPCEQLMKDAHESIAKADAFLSGKQEEKKVRFGCHVNHLKNGEVFNNCAFDMKYPIAECAQTEFLNRKEDCPYWLEIKDPA